MSITTNNRFESFQKLNRKRLYDLIISILNDNANNNGLTSREIAVILYNKGYIKSNERHATAPRLTELVDKGVVEVIGKKIDEISLKNVAVYSIVNTNMKKELT